MLVPTSLGNYNDFKSLKPFIPKLPMCDLNWFSKIQSQWDAHSIAKLLLWHVCHLLSVNVVGFSSNNKKNDQVKLGIWLY